MLRITQEMNAKEMAFISSEPDDTESYQTKIFTPTKEITFSGHILLATAYVINHFLVPVQLSEIKLKLNDGVITINSKNLPSDGKLAFISKHKPVFFSEQGKPEFGKTFDRVLLSRILNIEVVDIDDEFPIQEVSIGLGFIIIPIKNLNAIKSISINKERYQWLVEKTNAKALLVFTPEVEHENNNIHVRVFAEYYGIHEDSASGSGNGCLAAYLAKYRYFDSNKVDIKVEQGYEINRPSQIIAQATYNDEIDVSIGGQIILIGKGELFV